VNTIKLSCDKMLTRKPHIFSLKQNSLIKHKPFLLRCPDTSHDYTALYRSGAVAMHLCQMCPSRALLENLYCSVTQSS